MELPTCDLQKRGRGLMVAPPLHSIGDVYTSYHDSAEVRFGLPPGHPDCHLILFRLPPVPEPQLPAPGGCRTGVREYSPEPSPADDHRRCAVLGGGYLVPLLLPEGLSHVRIVNATELDGLARRRGGYAVPPPAPPPAPPAEPLPRPPVSSRTHGCP